jgi:hypothetical protein
MSTESGYTSTDLAALERTARWREAHGTVEERRPADPPAAPPSIERLLDLASLNATAEAALAAEREAEETLREAEARDRDRAARADAATAQQAQRFGIQP